MSTLAAVLRDHDVLIVSGTGGVGKTTVSASLALAGALSGRKALVMTIDPARRLADSLGVSATLNQATEIDVEGMLGRPLPDGGSLHAMMLDAKTTFDGMVGRFAPDEKTRDRILGNEYYQRASESLGGSQEYMAMEKLREVATSDDYDLIVLDTPPTRNALDFLEAPDRLLSMLHEGALSWLFKPRGQRFSGSRAGRAIFGRGQQAMFGIFERFTGLEVVQGISEFVSAFSSLLDGMGGRANEVMDLLKGDRAAFVLVASPNRIALSEALYFHDRLAEADVPFRGFVINRVRASAAPGSVPLDPFEEGFGRGDDAWNDAVQAVWAAFRRQARQATIDRHHIDGLKEHCGDGVPYVEVPELEGEVHDLAALQQLLTYLA